MKKILLAILVSFIGFGSSLQAQLLDKIVAVVGEDIILLSDVENQFAYFIANGQKDDGTLRCQILEKLIIEKLLLNKARQDSLTVTDDQIESELGRKLNYFIQGFGSIAKLEEEYHKPLIEIKADLWPEIQDQLLVERMREQIISKVVITPREVKKFYNGFPSDSLPYLPAEVELFHIVKRPVATDAAIKDAKAKLETAREQIVRGEVGFQEMAKKISEDFGSARLGGDLGEFGRGRMVPAFEEIAFKSKEGEISQVFKSEFGFHIMQVYKIVGELVSARHILVAPRVNYEDELRAEEQLKEIRAKIEATDTLTFERAAREYSDDDETKTCGGCIKNPQTGETRIPLDLLDADFYLKVDEMKEGDITEPMEWIQPDNKKVYHMLYLKKRVAPHVASLEADYQKIQSAALQAKQAGELERWLMSARKNIFIEIKDTDCKEVLSNWIQ
ncbi:MAG: peptidylprolyl isomerase [Bacteroidetes bacterium]|jgi:peptidyl-prolyl cis-trans isomerase SurA|nr:peptidylprolyl isomerase [Bacteroidota bacterium]MBL0017735.1 peptidylprolyl isomerase [Bacteroidota bacterium]MBP6639006.1 peptidylprolyl isomerase [Bacteroidia bacterium]